MSSQERKQKLLIESLSKSRSTISKWYKNESQPDIFDLHKIAALLGVTMEELIEV